VDLAEICLGLDLVGTDLVVLSACETAVSSFTPSGEAVSLSSFMLMAGARRVVGSLWDVNDDSTTLLMSRFHKALAQGSGVADALTQAQRELRTLSPDAVLDAFRDLARFCESDSERDALDTMSERIPARDATPFAGFDRWAPFVLAGMPGTTEVPKPRR
jgi:CHAT domain-containing protein